MLRIFTATLLGLFAFSPLFADAPENIGPAVGSVIPHDLALKDASGTPRSFDELVGDNGMILVFFRSAKWCPYCQKQLIELNKSAKAFEDAGYPLVGLSYDMTTVLERFTARRSIDFALLSDQDSAAIDAFGIRNTSYKMGHFAHGVPYPLIAIIGKDGVLHAKLHEASYKKRPQVEAINEALQRVQAVSAATSR